jgi:hypothetical protein
MSPRKSRGENLIIEIHPLKMLRSSNIQMFQADTNKSKLPP